MPNVFDARSGASVGQAPVFADHRGRLTLTEFGSLEFDPARAYVIEGIPVGARRGGHASRSQHRQVILVSGRVRCCVVDGAEARSFELGPAATVHVPPGTWFELEALDAGVCVLVLASGEYDPGDYVGRPPNG